jgi:homoserine dehydrogenase
LDIHQIPRQHIGDLDAKELRSRRDHGATTRLVARADRDGRLQVAYEEVDLDAPLAVTADRVIYTYSLASGQTRVHVGAGVGPVGTARAILADVAELCA